VFVEIGSAVPSWRGPDKSCRRTDRTDLARETNPTRLRVTILDELRQSIGFDAYAWLLTDPDSTVGAAPLAEHRGSVTCRD
jgi:hypothetical protein